MSSVYDSSQKPAKHQDDHKYLLSGGDSRASGFFDNSSKAPEINRGGQQRPREQGNASGRVEKPQFHPHLSASMLSQNDFGSHGHQRSAVEAMEARKQHSQAALNESHQNSLGQPSHRTFQPEGGHNDPQSNVKHQNYFGKPKAPDTRREVVSLDQKIEELTKMPGIHDMANGYFCPMPLYYSKVRKSHQKSTMKPVDRPQRPFTTYSGIDTQPEKGQMFSTAYATNATQPSKQKSINEAGQFRPTTAPPVHNTIVLNEKATKQILQDTDFQLQVNQGMLLDILLKELVSLKSGQATDPANRPEALRVVLDNPQVLAALAQTAAPPAQRLDERPPAKEAKRNSGNYLPNESLKDSVFQQSANSKKPDNGRRRDLESINEDLESKGSIGYGSDFASVKDEHMFSLSASHPANNPSKMSQSGFKNPNNKFSNQPPQKKYSDNKAVDDGNQ